MEKMIAVKIKAAKTVASQESFNVNWKKENIRRGDNAMRHYRF